MTGLELKESQKQKGPQPLGMRPFAEIYLQLLLTAEHLNITRANPDMRITAVISITVVNNFVVRDWILGREICRRAVNTRGDPIVVSSANSESIMAFD